MPRGKIRTALVLVFRIACFVAFLLQIISLSSNYFRFATRTRVEQSVGGKVLVPNLALCSRYTELASRDPLALKFQALKELGKEMKIADLFNNSPSANESMIGCATRPADNPYLMVWKSREECLTEFNIIRFYMQEYMCYEFRWRKETLVDNDKVAHSLRYGGVFYIISLSDTMNRIFHLRPILFTADHPTGSRMYGQVITRRAAEPMSSKTFSNLYEVTYAYTEFQLLKFPYDTMCIITGGTNDCERHCVIDHVYRQTNKLPFSEIIYENDRRTKTYHLNHDDLNNKTTYTAYKKILKECGRRCRGRSCNYGKVNSRTNSEPLPDHTNIRIFVMIPDTTKTKIIHEPAMYPVEFVVLILSCFGIWFGVSVIALNPFDSRQSRVPAFVKQMIKKLMKRDQRTGARVGH